MGRKPLDTEQWVAAARQTHGDRYDYSQAAYSCYAAPITIVCREHGMFVQQENNHRNGAGCPACGLRARKAARSITFKDFVERANATHGNRYAYHCSNFANSRSMVTIICPEHGEFEQLAYVHLNGCGCRACGYATNGRNSRLDTAALLKRAAETHNGNYTYDILSYQGMHANMRITCSRHGVFEQTPSNHLKGAACPSCSIHQSCGENELRDFIKTLEPNVVIRTRSVIPPKELDIYLQKVVF